MNRYAMGDNIAIRLRKQHRTQKEMCEALGYNYYTLSAQLNGHNKMSAYQLYRIAKYLGCTMDELMDGVDDE